MPIKFYSTTVSASKTAGEIVAILTRRGVRSISLQYSPESQVIGLAFELQTEYGTRFYDLPIRTEGVLAAMKREKVERRYLTPEQAERTAWRIAQDWMTAQFALIDAGLASTDEIFMPFLSSGGGETLYSVMRNKWMKELES